MPLSAYAELTYACNWRCVFCYNPRHSDVQRLSSADWLAAFDDLRALGALHIYLTGGEPMAHPEFLAIARGVRDRHMVLHVYTNGTLVDEAIADELAELGANVEISLHGATAETHDRTTQRKGSFDATVRGASLLKQRGVTVELKTSLTRLNEHELEAMISLAHSMKMSYRYDMTLSPNDNGDTSALNLTVTPEGMRRATEIAVRVGLLQPLKRVEGGRNCGLGRTSLAIDPEGNVYPCIKWRKSSIGNLREMPLRAIWSSGAREEAAQIAVDANTRILEIGGAAAEFPFCPALAATGGGDPLTPDHAFLQRAAITHEVRSAIAAV